MTLRLALTGFCTKVPISLFLSFRLKVLSFMYSEFKKPKKISASKYAFLSKRVRNLSFVPSDQGLVPVM